MSNTPDSAASNEVRSDVRLRRPERMQVIMRMECDDELIPQGHQARVIWEVVQKLDPSAFCEPIQARDGVRGRNATARLSARRSPTRRC